MFWNLIYLDVIAGSLLLKCPDTKDEDIKRNLEKFDTFAASVKGALQHLKIDFGDFSQQKFLKSLDECVGRFFFSHLFFIFFFYRRKPKACRIDEIALGCEDKICEFGVQPKGSFWQF